MKKIRNFFTIFRNFWILCKYDLEDIIANDLDKLIENGVNDKYNELIKKLTNILDSNSEIYKKLERETYRKRTRPDVSLRNMNKPVSKETRQKMKESWVKRKEKQNTWDELTKE